MFRDRLNKKYNVIYHLLSFAFAKQYVCRNILLQKKYFYFPSFSAPDVVSPPAAVSSPSALYVTWEPPAK